MNLIFIFLLTVRSSRLISRDPTKARIDKGELSSVLSSAETSTPYPGVHDVNLILM